MSDKIQLFILPFSGSKAAQFDEFCMDLKDKFDIITVEYAGRGQRAKENYITDYDSFMKDICNRIQEKRKMNVPFCILGYSIGGFFAYDLYAKGYISEKPKHLFICACENNKDPLPPISELPENEFWDRVISMGGVDKRLIEKRKFLKLFSKTMRADFHIGEQHRYTENDKTIDCPVSVFYSESDTPYSNVQRWQEVSLYPVDFVEFPGDHFFIFEHHELVASKVKEITDAGT